MAEEHDKQREPREDRARSAVELGAMADDFDDDVEEPAEAEPDPAELFGQVLERCKAADIDVEEAETLDGEQFLRIALPAGRDKRSFAVHGHEAASRLLATPFERYRFVSGYEAICSYEDAVIEAAVRPAGTGVTPATFAFSRIFGRRPRPDSGDSWPHLITLRPEVDGEDDQEAIELGPPSDVAGVVLGPVARRGVSVRIRGRRFTTNEQARRVLESHTDSLFFQIDAKLGVPIELRRERRRSLGRRRRKAEATVEQLEYPRYIYDREPMSLYWYGRGATGMPLLQFLAYYQVMEFYFPVYAQEEVRRRLRNILKDPGFSAHAERDIGRLVDVLSSAGGRSVWGDERSQLRATLRACVDAGAIRDLISSDDYDGHFEKKIKGLTNTTLRVAAEDDDLVSRTAERVYEIRCKIVHTKEDGGLEDVGLLLPFSAEAERLEPDIELAELVSRRVLAAAARPVAGR
jgi:hypothetical protein